MAKNLQWRGKVGAGGNLTATAANWWDLGTSADSTTAPTNADTCTVNPTPTNVDFNVNSTLSMLSFDASGTSGLTISGANTINCYGNFKLDANVTWTKTGNLYNYTNSCNFDTAGIDMSSLTIIGFRDGAHVTLQSDLLITDKSLFVYGASTELNTANYTITCRTFGDSGNAGAISLTLGTSTLNIQAIVFTAATVTIVNTTHTFNIVADGVVANNFRGGTWGTVNFHCDVSSARTYTFSGMEGASFAAFNITHDGDRRDTNITLDGNFTINDNSSWLGGGAGQNDPTYRPFIYSSAPGTARVVTMAANKTLTQTDIDLRDIKVITSGTGDVVNTRVGNRGGCSRVDDATYTQNVSDPRTVYLAGIATTRNWYDYSAGSYGWATAIGSSYANRQTLIDINAYPLTQDTASLDDYTFSGASRIVIINTSLAIGNIDTSTLTDANTLSIQSVTCYGDLLLNAAITVSNTGATQTFDARVKNELASPTPLTINVPSGTIGTGNITINSYGGTVQLASNLTHTGAFSHLRGVFDQNDFNLSCGSHTLSAAGITTREYKTGTGTLTVTGTTGTLFNAGTITDLTWTDEGCTLIVAPTGDALTGDVIINLGGLAFSGGVTLSHHTGDYTYTVVGNSTIGTYTQEADDATPKYNKVLWTSPGTYTITTAFNAAGLNNVNFTSSAVTPGTQYTLHGHMASVSVTNLAITDSAAEGGAIWNAGTGCKNGGNNTGWLFEVAHQPWTQLGPILAQ